MISLHLNSIRKAVESILATEFNSKSVFIYETHLDKREFYVESRKITQPDEERIITGEGMPVHKFPSQKGDLYITLNVNLPKIDKFVRLNLNQCQGFRPHLLNGENCCW